MDKTKKIHGLLEVIFIFLIFISLYAISCVLAKIIGIYHIVYWYSFRYGEMTGELVIFSVIICIIGIVLFTREVLQDHKIKKK